MTVAPDAEQFPHFRNTGRWGRREGGPPEDQKRAVRLTEAEEPRS